MGSGEEDVGWLDESASVSSVRAALFDGSPLALAIFDADGEVRATNPAWLRVLGCEAADVAGSGFARLLDDESNQRLRIGLDVARRSKSDGGRGIELLDVVLQPASDPGRYLALRFGAAVDDAIVASLADVTAFFHAMMVLAYSANTTMVVDAAADIVWGPVGRYAAQEMGSPWYGRGEATPFGWLHPEDIGRVLQAFQHVLDNPRVVHEITVRTRHVILEDQWGTATIRAINLIDDPLIGGVLVQTHAEGEEERVSLGRTTGSFQSIAQAAPIGIILSDHLGRPLYWNDVAREVFDLGPIDRSDGATDADVDWPSLSSTEGERELRDLLGGALAGRSGMATVPFHLPGGDVWMTVAVAPQLNDVGEPMGWLATLQDVTRERTMRHDLEAAQERLVHLALHDPLTELANRRMFAEHLARAIARSKRDGQAVALLFCDLDGFKPVNDARGHDAGDDVLVQVAHRLGESIRGNDLAARLGGDEFVVLVEGFSDTAEVEVVARRLVEAMSAPIAVNGGRGDSGDDAATVTIGMSIGVAIAGPDDTADSLLSRADDLMYQAKAAGKGRYVLDGGAVTP